LPCYDERCRDCGTTFEIVVLSFTAPRPCPECGSEDTEQLISVPHFQMAARRFEIKHGQAQNPFAGLTLQHIRGDDGKPITVNSERELRAAEKRYGFVHAASWGLEKEPPQHEKDAGNIARDYKWKFNRDPNARKRPESHRDVSAGVVMSANETLANHPNASRILKG
jgi:putative FmdB family regulatory protein